MDGCSQARRKRYRCFERSFLFSSEVMRVRRRRKLQGYKVCRHWRTALIATQSGGVWESRSTWEFSGALGALASFRGCQELLLGINEHETFD